MNYCAYEILSIVEELEGIDHPEMIPSPEKIRLDPEFAEALDYLLERKYVEICKSRCTTHHDEDLSIELGYYVPGANSLTITPAGLAALEEEYTQRIDLRSS
jgi:hypothetical protein